jgi:serine/threonine protein kinase
MKLSSLIGQTLDEKYFIDKQLGRGGMGAVFLATHLGTGRPVAVKVIAPQFMANDEFVERFKREAKAAGRLRHPNVVDVTDFGFAAFNSHRLAYLVMEYLDGCSLADILAEESRLPLEWVIDILEQACSAVDEAHKQGIVHRDLKPDNIWLEPNRRSGYTVKVLDFGLAKLGDPTTPENEEPLSVALPQAGYGAPTQVGGNQTNDGLHTQIIEDSKTTQVSDNATYMQTAPLPNELKTQVAHEPDALKTQIAHEQDASKTQITHRQDAAQTQIIHNQQVDTPVDEAAMQMPSPQAKDGLAAKMQTAQADETQPLVQSIEEAKTFAFNNATGEEAQTLVQTIEEVQTRIQLIDEEQQTRIQVIEDEQTRILTQEFVQEEATRILTEQTYESHQAFSFDTSDGLTRVGSVLGTPLYMSPEQCRSQPLDARADIYSLGVIAYQMLSGVTPFSGDMTTVMEHHVKTPAPSFKEVTIDTQKRKKKYKIPPRTEEIILSALAKNPADRPASAAAFASSLRATSEGAGVLLRRAFALYSEYFPKFFMASLLVNIPGFLLYGLEVLNTVLIKTQVIPKIPGVITGMIFGLLKFVLSFLASSVLSGVTVWMVTHLMLAPLRPVRVRKAFAAVKRKWRAVLTTTLLFSSLILLGFILLFIPGLLLMITYALTMPVVMMENLSGRAAMRRAKALAKRSKRTVVFIVLIQFGIPFLSSMIIGLLVGTLVSNHQLDANVAQRITEFMRIPVDLLVVPLISIMTGLLYLKMRLAGGEDLSETLSQFEEADAPQTNWQKRMRERLSITTHPSK